jgi:hypothetical protein
MHHSPIDHFGGYAGAATNHTAWYIMLPDFLSKRPNVLEADRRLSVANSEGHNHSGQSGDNRKGGDYHRDRDQIAIKLQDALGFLQLPLLLFRNKLLRFRNKLLRVGGSNLGAPRSARLGDNLIKGPCH